MANDTIYSLIYRSVAKEGFRRPDVQKMLERARVYNHVHDITGCLVEHEGIFLQMIEGSEEEVLTLYQRIERDTRHEEFRVLCKERILNRLFGEWNMLYTDFTDDPNALENKRQFFRRVFHDSSAPMTPCRSKLVLWNAAQEILSSQRLVSGHIKSIRIGA